MPTVIAILFILLFISISIGVTYLLHKVVRVAFVKYIPALIPLYFTVEAILQLSYATEGMLQLASFLMILLFAPSVLAVLITGLILDNRQKKQAKKGK